MLCAFAIFISFFPQIFVFNFIFTSFKIQLKLNKYFISVSYRDKMSDFNVSSLGFVFHLIYIMFFFLQAFFFQLMKTNFN